MNKTQDVNWEEYHQKEPSRRPQPDQRKPPGTRFRDWKTQYHEGAISPQTNTQATAVLTKLPITFFSADRDENILWFIWKGKGITMAKQFFKRRMKLKHLIRFQGFQATEIKTAWHWRTDGHSEEWNRMQSPEAALHKYSLKVFHKGAKATQWKNGKAVNKGSWSNWAKKKKREPWPKAQALCKY